MSTPPGASGTARSSSVLSPSSRFWLLLLARAAVALALGLAITFSSDHSAMLGLTLFGVSGILAGVVLAATGAVASSGLPPRSRQLVLVQALVTLLAGAIALLLRDGGEIALVAVVASFAVITGALELWSGILIRRAHVLGREQLLLGALSVLLGLVLLVIPTGLEMPFSGVDKEVSGVLTSSIILVGLIGAWGVISGVLLAIASVTVRGESRDAARIAAGSEAAA